MNYIQYASKHLRDALKSNNPEGYIKAALRLLEEPPSEPDKCIKCQSPHIVAGNADPEEDILFRNVYCEDCEENWDEIFRFQEITQ